MNITPLQWGRDLMIAEIDRRREKRLKDILLQWGRDLMIAEIPCLWLPNGPYPRFNGAAI